LERPFGDRDKQGGIFRHPYHDIARPLVLASATLTTLPTSRTWVALSPCPGNRLPIPSWTLQALSQFLCLPPHVMAGPAKDALPGGRLDFLSPAEGLCTRIKSEAQRATQEQVRANSKLKDHAWVEMRDKEGLARRLPLLSRRIL